MRCLTDGKKFQVRHNKWVEGGATGERGHGGGGGEPEVLTWNVEDVDIVSSRVALLLRSAEIKPFTWKMRSHIFRYQKIETFKHIKKIQSINRLQGRLELVQLGAARYIQA